MIWTLGEIVTVRLIFVFLASYKYRTAHLS